MNVKSQIGSYRYTQTFNNSQRFIEGWYWAIPSEQVRKEQVKAVTLLGRKLAVYRGKNGQIHCIDAYCPHMGAHLAEGKVEDNSIRCLFHNWKFDAQGNCVEVPCLGAALPVSINTWPAVEKYGLVWVWTGKYPKQPLPFVPELELVECDRAIGSHFLKNCHPNVVMINAIDAHHFNSAHNLPLEIVFQKQQINENAITFNNITPGGNDSIFLKLIRRFYKDAITYNICYWYGSISTVTFGPDFLHFHIMLALRLIEGGKAEGQTIFLTKKRRGIFGWLCNRMVLWLTLIIGNYFYKGDNKIFKTINFDLKTPTKADYPIIQFIHHVERQKPLTWETWESVEEIAQHKKLEEEKWITKGESND